MKRLWLDTETRSAVPIKRGVAKYATGVKVTILAWATNDAPVTVLDLTNPLEVEFLLPIFLSELAETDEIWAHNAEFDRTVLEEESWWPETPWEKWRCTMAMARMHGLPGALDKLCQIFKLSVEDAKSADGKSLIHIFCIPKKDGTYNDRHSHPVEWQVFLDYGAQDVVAMRAIWKKTPHWNATARMWKLWHLDQRMNAKGVAFDIELAQSAVTATTKAKRRMADRVEDMTLGTVEAATQVKRLRAYLEAYGVDLPDLKADTVERRLNDENLPEHVKELLRIRQQASKSSTTKYQRVLDCHLMGRMRNLLMFCGAARTGRFAGRTFQPQNLPRPKHKQWQIEMAIELFKLDGIELYDPDMVLGLGASCLRSLMIAGPGKKLCVADLANIEGRIMAWIAGEDWKLAAFAAYDAKLGPDLYKLSYARAFNIDPNDIADEGDHRRQIGKVMELALQYYGGVGAFCAMAETYGLKLEELYEAAWPEIPDAIKTLTAERWNKAKKRRRTYGLDEMVWRTCEALVTLWRRAHPGIVKFWENIEKAVKGAIHARTNEQFTVGRIVVDRKGNWLRIRLPSGRYLLYPAPRFDLESGGGASFIGVNPYTKQWGRISTYSGKLTENIVQAIAADILFDGLLAADEAGYDPILSVHDELITEPANDPIYDDKGLSKLMVNSSPWSTGMPLAAKGFTAQRYKK